MYAHAFPLPCSYKILSRVIVILVSDIKLSVSIELKLFHLLLSKKNFISSVRILFMTLIKNTKCQNEKR